MTFRIAGRVLNPDRIAETSGVGVRIRSLQSAQLLFATTTKLQEIHLPETSRFEVEVSLEMNVEPGLYSIETGIFNRTAGKPIMDGPRVSVTVLPDFSFVGRSFARPTMKLLTPDHQDVPRDSVYAATVER